MNKQTLQAIAYCQNALSFLFLDADIDDLIKGAYLHGSAARAELSQESDIDLLLDCEARHEKTIEGIAKAALSRFYESKDYEKWRRYRFRYPISVQAGDLNTWQLKTSIRAEGIQLYSKNPGTLSIERQTLFIYALPKKKTDYLRFIRAFFGRKEKGYQDQGMLGQAKGKKLGSNVILIPKENQQLIEKFLQKEKTDYRMMEVGVF
ncbi:MAG: nucleotidyltransferase domain-containing protein [Nanoarchaeota archaeon]